jgi:hypothetical protein
VNKFGWDILCACSEAPLPQDRLLEQLSEGIEESAGLAEGRDEAGKSLNREELANVLEGHLDQLSQLGLLEGGETLAA